jgi:glycosyltransferase involved in cell wall biosynthesis
MPHGTYFGHYNNDATSESSRESLGISNKKFVYLFFGNIRGYKGVENLLVAYRKISSSRKDVVLVIAGKPTDPNVENEIYRAANLDETIIFKAEFIKDNEVQHYFKSADIVMLPYQHILTSGSALLGITFSRPIIAPRAGVLPELIEIGKHGYLFNDYSEMSNLMHHAVSEWQQDRAAWSNRFEFFELNEKLNWTVLTANDAFGRILLTE